jgi:hypothetical protein
MSKPEVLSVAYQDILARTFAGSSGGFRNDIEVSPGVKSTFMDTMTLPTPEKYSIAHVFFMIQSVVKLQHSPDVLPPNSWNDYHGDQTEVMKGLCFEKTEDYVAIDEIDKTTLFTPLSQLVLAEELPEFTKRNVLAYSADGRYGDPVSRALLPLIELDRVQ